MTMPTDQANLPRVAIAARDLDLRDALHTLMSWRKLVAGVFVAVLALGCGYALLATPIYVADSLIQVEDKKGSAIAGLQEIATALDVGQSPVAGELEIIKSREVIGSAIRALRLDIETRANWRAPYFANAYDAAHEYNGELAAIQWGLAKLAWGGERLMVDSLEAPADVPLTLVARGDRRWQLNNADGELLAEGLVGESVDFKVEGRDARIQIARMNARPDNSFEVVKRSFDHAYSEIRDNLNVAEVGRQSSVIRVKSEAPSRQRAVELVNEITKAYLTQNVSRRTEEAQRSLEFLEQQLPRLRSSVELAEESLNRYRLSRQSIDLNKESEALLNHSIDLEKQLLEAEMQRDQLKIRFQPGHPELAVINRQIDVLRGEKDRIAAAIKRLPATQQEFLRLQRDVTVNTDLYVSLLNNAQELRIAKAGTTGNVRVIDFAVAPDEPAKPKKKLVLLATLVLATILGVAAALIARALRPRLHQVSELEHITSLPTYATIPESQEQGKMFQANKPELEIGTPRLLFESHPADPAAEALRAMRMGVQFALVGADSKNIVITGPSPAVGKTFVSANLAAALAAGDKKVLLIDADMRRPQVHRYFGVTGAPGLSEYLIGALAKVMHKNILPNLDLICAGTVPPNPGELLVRGRLQEMLRDMQSQYDYILIDTPPILPVGDILTLGKAAAAVFLVVRADETTAQQVGESLRRLESAGINAKGTIFNGVYTGRFGYGAGYYDYRYTPKKR